MNTTVKYLFVVLNLLFAVSGVLLIGFTSWIRYGSHIYEVISDVNNIQSSNAIFVGGIIVGCFLTVIGSMGAVGAVYEKRSLLISYLSIIAALLVVETIVLIYAVIRRDSFRNYIIDNWNKLNDTTTDALQSSFECCGATNSSDWTSFADGSIPQSCYSCVDQANSLCTVGCSEAIWAWMKVNVVFLISITALLFVLQIFQLVVTSCLIYQVTNKVRTKEDESNNGKLKIRSGRSSVYNNDVFFDDT